MRSSDALEPTVVREVEGLWTLRRCLAVKEGYRWIEVPRAAGPYHPVARFGARLTTLRRVLEVPARTWLDLAVPSTAPGGGAFLYGTVAQPHTFFDIMSRVLEEDRGGVFITIGRRLAELHAAPVCGGGGGFSDRPAVWLDEPTDEAAARSAHLASLHRALRACGAIRELARRGTVGPAAGPRVLLHGRWSSGVILPSSEAAENLVVLGGVDFWLGPREYDLGYLTGEILESVAEGFVVSRPYAAESALAAVAGLLEGYGLPVSPRRLAAFTARRVVSHLVANAMWRFRKGLPPADPAALVALLTVAERLLPHVRAAAERNGSRGGLTPAEADMAGASADAGSPP